MLLRDSSTGAHVLPVTSTNESGNQTALDTRRLAQWAINAVCFQTNDSIMVPFKYDLNPLTAAGWQSDDDITNVDADGSSGVVWGCKPPELLLTEAAAFHNRGVGDTKFATPSMAARETPRATARRTPVPAGQSGHGPGAGAARLVVHRVVLHAVADQPKRPDRFVHVQRDHGGMVLDVGRTAPDGTPVWRIVVSKSRFTNIRTATSAATTSAAACWPIPTVRPSSRSSTPGDTTSEFSLLTGADGGERADRTPDFHDNDGAAQPP